MNPSPLRAGLFGIGLDAYWPQFAGLKQQLEGYLDRVPQNLARPGVEMLTAGLVDNPDRAFAAGHELRRADVDVIFYMSQPMRCRPRCCLSCSARRFRSSCSTSRLQRR